MHAYTTIRSLKAIFIFLLKLKPVLEMKEMASFKNNLRYEDSNQDVVQPEKYNQDVRPDDY